MDPLLPEEILDTEPTNDLWLSTRLMDQLHRSSTLGIILMVSCYVYALSAGLYTLMRLQLMISHHTGDFYLLEGGNLKNTYSILSSFLILYLFVRSTKHGYQAWKCLKKAKTSDDALLEGTEQLGKMFRWLTLWGAVFVASLIVDFLIYDVFFGIY